MTVTKAKKIYIINTFCGLEEALKDLKGKAKDSVIGEGLEAKLEITGCHSIESTF